MCRSILTLRDKEFTDADVHAAALQFVRKLSGYRKPSQANTQVFDAAVEEIAIATEKMLGSLQTQTRKTTRERVA